MMPQATDAGKLEFPALLMDALPDGVLMRAAHGELLGVNSAFCRMTGYGREEVIASLTSWMESRAFNL